MLCQARKKTSEQHTRCSLIDRGPRLGYSILLVSCFVQKSKITVISHEHVLEYEKYKYYSMLLYYIIYYTVLYNIIVLYMYYGTFKMYVYLGTSNPSPPSDPQQAPTIQPSDKPYNTPEGMGVRLFTPWECILRAGEVAHISSLFV